MSKDLYNTHAARLDTIIGGDASHYIRLRRCKEEYDQEARELNFVDYVKEQYGIELEWGNDNGIGLDYAVVDEKKYMVFVLKFSV